MRAHILLPLLPLAACVIAETPPPQPMPPPPPVAAPAPRPPPSTAVDERAAVARAFDYARDRGLTVDHVHRAHLDPSGRWHVDLRGPGGDRALLLIDGGDGRLLKGHFREKGQGAEQGERDDVD